MNPFNNIPDYPDIEDILKEIWKLPRYITIDAEKTAKEAGSIRAANIVILGAAAPFIGLKYESLEQAIRNIFGKKGEELINMNLKALKLGYDYAKKNR
jgi:indolepyruvate ferredoxin oxidoreductase beta subunit